MYQTLPWYKEIQDFAHKIRQVMYMSFCLFAFNSESTKRGSPRDVDFLGRGIPNLCIPFSSLHSLFLAWIDFAHVEDLCFAKFHYSIKYIDDHWLWWNCNIWSWRLLLTSAKVTRNEVNTAKFFEEVIVFNRLEFYQLARTVTYNTFSV